MGTTALPWERFVAQAPDLVSAVEARFRAHPHHVLATLRRDGSPRLNGTNIYITAGRLWFGAMQGTARAADLRRDPRVAVHSAPLDRDLPPGAGDARMSGHAVPLTAPDARLLLVAELGEDRAGTDGDFFELHVEAASIVEVHGTQLVVRSWTATGGEQVRFRS